ncbi:hypothetical protein SLE2022_362890 [Rubroshorea leprosula]
MNTKFRKESDIKDADGGAVGKNVETVEIRSSPGRGQEQRTVQVTHQVHQKSNTNTSGGVLQGAAAAVASTLESAKNVISDN